MGARVRVPGLPRRPATPRRRPASVPAARVLLVLLAAVLGLAGMAAPAATAAPGRVATATPSPTADDALPVRVQITEVSPTVLRPGQNLVVRARLTNTSAEEISNPRALVHLERIRPGTRDDLQRWLDEPLTGRRVGSRVAQVTAEGPLAPGATVDLEVTVPADVVGLLDRPDTWGARGLSVQAVSAGQRVGLQRSFVLWATQNDDVPQTRVSLLAPFVGPAPVPQGVDITAPGPTLGELVGPGGRLDSMLDVARTSPDVAIVVDPALLAAARTGTDAEIAWSGSLTATAVGRDVVALPWSDPDLTALAHGGAVDMLDAAVDASATAVSEAIDGGRPLSARTDVLWAPGPATDQATVDLAAQAGAAVLVLAPEDLPMDPDLAGGRTELTSTTGTLVGLVPDSTLTTLLTHPEQLVPDPTHATVVQRVLAELSVLARGSAEGLQHVLIALPRDADPDPDLVEAVLGAVQGAPWSRTAPLTALLGAQGAGALHETLPALVDDPQALAPEQVRRLADARNATVAFAAATGEGAATLLTGVDTAVLAPVATAWRADPAGRQALVDAVVKAVDAKRVGLTLAPTSNQNRISAYSEVRFSVRNDLPAAASVRVETRPRKGCLRTEPSETVLVPAGGVEVVPVQVHAIANCDVVVEAVLTSADGAPLGDPVTFEFRASPTIESVGTAVVGALLAVGLVLGVARTVRRGQSARRGARRVDGDAGTRPLPVLGGTPEGDDT
ncbi:DUF6049 family protein [Cellulomonas xiejunii]|uniref:DUF6049 family protein n=1 Tax=Cellulomonas xiejunii TaxID=2968083 RepID=A0ABY5KQ68_9CELL|nr:DUF6049 family protein [Cellulomonas xiejunii]MCC2321301.1 DUF6049 family protein [Cellulomonas xiejunii]UUI71889.1 DUF6049 family protein [Cellulomonas xiejunii]